MGAQQKAQLVQQKHQRRLSAPFTQVVIPPEETRGSFFTGAQLAFCAPPAHSAMNAEGRLAAPLV